MSSAASISYPHHQMAAAMRHPGAAVQSAGRQQQQQQPLSSRSMATTCYTGYEPQKDYSRPLHVDCSVEYELPNTAKPPQGVRNEPLLMIHPCYFRKIESQRRSPFINNLPQQQQQAPTAVAATTVLPVAAPVLTAAKRRMARTSHQQPSIKNVSVQPAMPQQSAQYPVQYPSERSLWEPMPPLAPISQSYCKVASSCGVYGRDVGPWAPEAADSASPDRPDDKHILSGKYRQYLRAHRLHPYVGTAGLPLAAAAFPQVQQVCYNV